MSCLKNLEVVGQGKLTIHLRVDANNATITLGMRERCPPSCLQAKVVTGYFKAMLFDESCQSIVGESAVELNILFLKMVNRLTSPGT